MSWVVMSVAGGLDLHLDSETVQDGGENCGVGCRE